MANADEHVEWLDSSECIITIHWRRWWGLVSPEICRYRGSSTVWRDADTGKRQSTHIEGMLSDIWTKAKWNRE